MKQTYDNKKIIAVDPALKIQNVGAVFWHSARPKYIDILRPNSQRDIYELFEKCLLCYYPDVILVEGTRYMGPKSHNQTYVRLSSIIEGLKQKYPDLVRVIDPLEWKRAICGKNKKKTGKRIIQLHLKTRGIEYDSNYIKYLTQHDLDTIGMLLYWMDKIKREGDLG